MLITYYATGWAVLAALVAFAATGRRERLDGLGVLLWAAVVAAATVAAVVLGRALLDLRGFGMINIAFRQLVVGLPLAAALMALRAVRSGWRTSVTVPGALVLAAAAVLAPVGLYMSLVEPNRLVVHRASLSVETVPTGQAVTIGVITDIQTTAPGWLEQRAVDALMATEPDVILFPGDLFQDTREAFVEQLPDLRRLLRGLRAPGGVFVVGGDVDTHERLTQATEGTEVRYLANEIVTTEVHGTALVIGGVELDYTSPAATEVVDRLEARPDANEVRILLAHRPDAVTLLPDQDPSIDLVVAGHTHGGQVVIPFFGPPHTLSDVPRAVAAGGLHKIGQRNIFVGSGVGVERNQAPRIRLMAPPSVAVVTLEALEALDGQAAAGA